MAGVIRFFVPWASQTGDSWAAQSCCKLAIFLAYVPSNLYPFMSVVTLWYIYISVDEPRVQSWKYLRVNGCKKTFCLLTF